MNITEFLEARIAEDEAEASQYQAYEQDISETAGWWEPTRVLAECAAKRTIIAGWEDPNDIMTSDVDAGYSLGIDNAVHALAAVYSDHPDYQQAWALADS